METIKTYTQPFLSIPAARIYSFIVGLLGVSSVVSILRIPLKALEMSGFTTVDYAVYGATFLSSLSIAIGFLFLALFLKSLLPRHKGTVYAILGGIALMWCVANLLSVASFVTEVPSYTEGYWYALINSFLSAFVNPVIVCGFIAYIVERAYTASAERRAMIGTIVLWALAIWVLLLTYSIVNVAIHPPTDEVAQ